MDIYSPEQTIADCFKYRNKIGLDIAIEALGAYRERTRKPNRAAVTEFAQIEANSDAGWSRKVCLNV